MILVEKKMKKGAKKMEPKIESKMVPTHKKMTKSGKGKKCK